MTTVCLLCRFRFPFKDDDDDVQVEKGMKEEECTAHSRQLASTRLFSIRPTSSRLNYLSPSNCDDRSLYGRRKKEHFSFFINSLRQHLSRLLTAAAAAAVAAAAVVLQIFFLLLLLFLFCF